MATDYQKFAAETIRMAGIALFAPLGKILLYPFQTFNEYGATMFFISLAYSLFLTYIGLVFIDRSYNIISQERKDL